MFWYNAGKLIGGFLTFALFLGLPIFAVIGVLSWWQQSWDGLVFFALLYGWGVGSVAIPFIILMPFIYLFAKTSALQPVCLSAPSLLSSLPVSTTEEQAVLSATVINCHASY